MNLFRVNSKGFTIVELIIVVAVIAILAALVAVGYGGLQKSARDKSLLSDVESVESEITRYAVKNNGIYDANLNWDSSAGQNSNISFLPSSGNVIRVYALGDSYCIKAYNPRANNANIQNAVTAGDCQVRFASAIGTGTNSTCALSYDENVYCWGYGPTGNLGNGSSTSSNVPMAINTSGVLSGKTIKAASAAWNRTCAIASDNNAYCWGTGTGGELGNGGSANSNMPVAVNTSGVLSGKTIKAISAGGNNTACVIASDNLAYCWGVNTSGQLGNGNNTNSNVPVAVSTSGVLSGKTIKSISVGPYSTCVIASDNNAYCWGLNGLGQLGNGSTTDSNIPVAVSTSGVLAGKTIKSISAGWNTTCAIASDDKAYCWGSGTNGLLGNGGTSLSNVPVAVSTSGVLAGKTVTTISAGNNGSSCLIASDRNVYCWGANTNGQLGNGSASNSSVPVAVNTTGVMPGGNARTIAVGGVVCVTGFDKKTYCWGPGSSGQLGNAGNTSSNVPVLVSTPSV